MITGKASLTDGRGARAWRVKMRLKEREAGSVAWLRETEREFWRRKAGAEALTAEPEEAQ